MIETAIENNLELQKSTTVVQTDALLCNVPLLLHATFYPLGFAVEIITNAQEILDAAKESWGHFHQRYARPALQFRVVISEDDSIDCPPHPTVRAQRYMLSIVADSHNQAVCDLKGSFASAWLSQSILKYRSYLRYHFIEAVVLLLLSTSYVTAIHAACVSFHGKGMLLCGDSGAGKSSLAYACARAGWTYTSDDASYLLGDVNPPRVIGNSRQVRFRPTAKELFPELHGRELTPRAEGKPSIEVPTSEFLNILTADEAQVQTIIYLNRQPLAIAELVPLPKATSMWRFYQSLYPVEEIRERQLSALEPLFDLEIYELRYRDLHHAINRLEQLATSKDIGLT
jgi:hypothetical protein